MNYNVFASNPTLSPQEIALRELVDHLLIVLSGKEQYIIKNRFALGEETKRKTLNEIGKHFGITRERVRQIEKTALRKLERNAQNTNLKTLTEFTKALLVKEGGVARDSDFKNLLLQFLPNISEEELQDLHLTLSLDSEICFESNTFHFHPYWRIKNIENAFLMKITSMTLALLDKSKKSIPLNELQQSLNSALQLSLSGAVIRNFLSISKAFKFTDNNEVGLYSWRHIHPRTLRDKIFFVLNKEKRAPHFDKISDLIKKAEFDEKQVNTQAVHNELIRNENFISIGRGIYALKTWGYKTGTVADVITEILSDGIPRSCEEITKEVMKQRHVKAITIRLNLKNKARFARVGRDKYALLGEAQAL
ncbi:hypothetical protein IPG41_06685 [Candidatus Peregrinibacteria bacterium]|nr:MAG: hypothetical protein IPG41_06685 [Candidatus Peregrinibacteria bacterium]